jgi:hypothetical protein
MIYIFYFFIFLLNIKNQKYYNNSILHTSTYQFLYIAKKICFMKTISIKKNNQNTNRLSHQ